MHFDNSAAWSVLMNLRVDGVDLEVSGFDADELRDVVRLLGTAVEERLCRTPVKARLRLGICGPPGAGKTIFAMRLIEWLRDEGIVTRDGAVHLPLDGYHLRNDTLDRLVCDGDCYPEMSGQPLRRIKGAPKTFDIVRFLDDLTAGADRTVALSLPAYCRETHEPREHRIKVGTAVNLLVAEGNYLLLDAPDWCRVREQLDLCVYLDVPESECRANLLARHRRGGRPEKDALRHINAVDAINIGCVSGSVGLADVIVRAEANHLVSIKFNQS